MTRTRVMTMAWARQAVCVLAVISIGCSTFSIRADRCPAYPVDPPASALSEGEVKIQYLGVGGYLVQRKDDVVLFGPEYSNPGLLEVMLDHEIRTDRALVDRLLPDDADRATAIVIGHSHYDHLLDTPYIANTHATHADIYGSTTTASLIASAVDPARTVDVTQAAAKGVSLEIAERMRLWPIRSEHSDQFRLRAPLFGIDLPFHQWRGEVPQAQTSLPTTASGWAEGEVFAYLLDFLDDAGQVEFRIYYQDSGTDAPIGFPWGGKGPPDGKTIDVALICLGGDFENLAAHPEAIIAATRPRFLLLGHWENFFAPQTDVCRTDRVDAIPAQPTKRFVKRAEAAMKAARLPGTPIVPCPTASVFRFPIDPSDDANIYRALKKNRATYGCAR